MRLSLVAHGFPPLEKAGVENFTAQLARGLAVRGHAVEVFVPRVREDLPDLSLRREERDGYGIQWLTTNSSPGDPREALDPPGCAEQFDQFLERERPELVHFHHVAKLGLGLIGAAHARRIPTVYTVHDYFPICHRIALLRPDLERCETIGDPQACARCDLALSVLNQQDTLGDYHLGVLPGQLDAEEAERLGATLAGRQDAVGFPAEEWQAATELRTELDLRRREAFRQVDRLIAPTRFLAERMVDGGLDRERIVHLPYGIDTSTLLGVPCANTAQLEARPLRVGFIGSLTKHKGVHVLLDAWEQLSPEAELHLWGDSTDRVYVERCREQAERIGARMHGAFEQRHLAQILARVDLVVVPSIWVENYPIAIREALAAGRPVLASDVGAIPESVRDGVDGRLFRVGDAADLARVLGELLADPASVVRLRNGAAPVCGLEAQVRDHERIYAEVAREVAARRPAKPAVLPHLEAISARREELLELSSAELFARSLEGLERLGVVLGAQQGLSASLLAKSLARNVRTQERLRDRTTERNYLRAEIEAHLASEEALRADSEWRAGQVTGFEHAIESLESEREWLRETLGNLEQRIEEAERAREWHAENERGLGEKAEWLETEVANRDAVIAEGERERERERQRLSDAMEATRNEAEAQVARERAEVEVELNGLREALDELSVKLERSQERIDALTSDLAQVDAERVWRESEMRAVLGEFDRIRGRLLPARFLLRDTIQRWRESVDANGSAQEGAAQ